MFKLLARMAVAVALALTLSVGVVQAQAERSYQTGNGPQTFSSMTFQLRAAGYGGPWDEDSVTSAYARTTGGAVTRVERAPLPAGPAPTTTGGTAIVVLPGLDSTGFASFTTLNTVFHSSGLAGLNYLGFSYNEALNSAYDPAETCQPIQQTEDRLASILRSLRATNAASSVILVGHSLGGVAAFDVAATQPDLTQGPNPFIRGVVTIDSPLGGITALERFFGLLGQAGPCAALDDLRGRSTQPWQAWLTQSAQWLLARSVHLAIVTNPEDGAVLPQAQGINGAVVNYTLDYVSPSGLLNHSAILTSPDALATIASWIASW